MVMRPKPNKCINQPAKKGMTGKQAPVKPWKPPVQKSKCQKHGESDSDESNESTSEDESEVHQYWSHKKAKHAPAAEEPEEEAEEPEPPQHQSHRKAKHATPKLKRLRREPTAEEIHEKDTDNDSDVDNMRCVQGNGNEDEVSKSWQQWTNLLLTILIAGWSYGTT